MDMTVSQASYGVQMRMSSVLGEYGVSAPGNLGLARHDADKSTSFSLSDLVQLLKTSFSLKTVEWIYNRTVYFDRRRPHKVGRIWVGCAHH